MVMVTVVERTNGNDWDVCVLFECANSKRYFVDGSGYVVLLFGASNSLIASQLTLEDGKDEYEHDEDVHGL
ncbi:hypothetical protein MTR_7g056453 [Medicago truncatula]|uniref:Uncharacterized protein n=1 Tax=Medicago truncatula TaxID=3880 RepID=A0A072U0L1_MEDTR|nr:hypothetical protein MTR_7g056453 [Medicago truncatula]